MRGKMILVIGLCFLVSACAGALPWNKQQYAGLSSWSWEPSSDCRLGEPICGTLHVMDGKEKQDIAFSIEKTETGFKVSYIAAGVTAFQGQEIRAAVEQVVSEDVKETFPGIVDTVVNAVLKAIAPIP